MRLLDGAQLGTQRAQPLGRLHEVMARCVGGGLRGLPFRPRGIERPCGDLHLAYRGFVSSDRGRGALLRLERRATGTLELACHLVAPGALAGRFLGRTRRRRDAVALARAQIRDSLLGGQQPFIGGSELRHGRAPGILRGGRAGQCGGHVGHRLVVRGPERALGIRQLRRLALQRRRQLLHPCVECLEAALGPDHGFPGRLARPSRAAGRLLRRPVPLFRLTDPLPSRFLRVAQCRQLRLGRGGGPARLTQGSPRRLLPPLVRCDDQSSGPCPERVVLLLVLRLQGEPAHLWLELGDEVGHTRQVVARLSEAGRRLVPAHLEALDARGLLEKLTPLLRPQR